MNENKLISLCIPTNGKVDFVLPVLESIYTQGVDDDLFEVIITDNGKDSVLGESIDKFSVHGNLLYYKSDLNGFLNQVDSFKRSNGLFIKMLNHRAKLIPGMLTELIALVKKYKEEQPVIYCSDGVLSKDELIECENFNSFVKELSYYSSWSAGVGIWAKDKTMLDQIEYNQMFPHASIIFEGRQESKYIIWNKKFMDMEDDPQKGGYNLFHTFAVVYLDIIKDLEKRHRIASQTFVSIKNDMRNFLIEWYYNLCVAKTQYRFEFTDKYKHITTYYSTLDYTYIVGVAHYRYIRNCVKNIYRRFWIYGKMREGIEH